MCTMKEKTINGFDKWEIEDAARTLINAEKIRNDKRKGFYSTVSKEVDKQAAAAQEAAIIAKTAQKLTKTFGKGM